MFGLGVQELIVLLVVAALVVWPCWRISTRMGFPGPLGLVSLIPGGLFVLLIVWAFLDWPSARRSAV